MSIRILLDHGVKEDHIVFVTFLVARGGGISVLRRAFPQVKILCGAVDDKMREGWLEGYHDKRDPENHGRKVWVMQPGMGQIGEFNFFNLLISVGSLILFRRGSLLSMIKPMFSTFFFRLQFHGHV